MKLTKFRPNTNENDPYLTFVNHCLRQLDDQSKEYRQQLNMKTSHLMGYTRTLGFSFEYMSSSSSFLPILHDEQQFKRMRHNIIGQPTPQQSQLAISATKVDLDNNPTDQESIQRTDIPNRIKTNDTKFENKITVHYTHQKRHHSFKRDINHIYDVKTT